MLLCDSGEVNAHRHAEKARAIYSRLLVSTVFCSPGAGRHVHMLAARHFAEFREKAKSLENPTHWRHLELSRLQALCKDPEDDQNKKLESTTAHIRDSDDVNAHHHPEKGSPIY